MCISRVFALRPVFAFLLIAAWCGPVTRALAQAGKEQAYGGVEQFVEVEGVRARFLVLVPDDGKPAGTPRPVWIGLHGVVGCSEHAMWAWHDAAAQAGAILIAPQGTARREKDGEGYNRWDTERDPRTFGAMLDAVAATTPILRERVALVGFSHGAWLALATLAREPERYHFAGVIAGSFWETVNDEGLRAAARRGVRVFYGAGQADEHVAKNYEATVGRLRALGFDPATSFPPDVGHDPRPFNPALLAAYADAVAPQP